MEKGSFHSSPPAEELSRKLVEDTIKGIPLPNQLPKNINFKEITAYASSALEPLISQNEDLMARLSVSLRQTSQLEERSAILEKENHGFRHRYESLREQFLILQEKDRRFNDNNQKLLVEATQSKSQLQKIEKIYAELYAQARAFQRRLQHLERYRARIRKAAHSVQNLAAKALPLEAELKRVTTSLTEELNRRTDAFAEERRTFQNSHQQMIASFEAKLTEIKKVMTGLQVKALERDTLFDEKIALENQRVFEQRQSELQREEFSARVNLLTSEGADLRKELKESLVERDALHRELKDLRVELPRVRETTSALQEQVESLQVLWTQKQRELEQLTEKNRALQRLNQELGIQLNQHRKEIQALKAERESDHFASQDRIKTLLAEIQMLRQQMVAAGQL